MDRVYSLEVADELLHLLGDLGADWAGRGGQREGNVDVGALDLDVVDEAERNEVEAELGIDDLLERLDHVVFGEHCGRLFRHRPMVTGCTSGLAGRTSRVPAHAAPRPPPSMSDSPQIVRRSIGIVFADGGLLALSALRPAGAGGHGEEELAAVLCDPDGAPVEVSEVLLSTEYGSDGVQRRASLELWVDDEGQPLRGAGALISARSVRRPGLHSEIAFFRWSVEGREGLGHYEIVRDDG
jgi:hypothetical protein